ncbi:uncharacterized protein LOC129238745 [Anastrepha obliqua]|uniref:uncharacterized protein LOC129238745 n=1 Tax=Anastrepha obliqua TaxID=95512 RepID=UPI00240909B3|nr:uncharacterized protein LOC129238745 [Anastrepha obliqua]
MDTCIDINLPTIWRLKHNHDFYCWLLICAQKYVSELSTVRDCATECVEKEIWETQTYCCNIDGCNGSNKMQISKPLFLLPLIYCIYKSLVVAFNERH